MLLPIGTKVRYNLDRCYLNKPTSGEIVGYYTDKSGRQVGYVLLLDNPNWLEGREHFISAIVVHADNIKNEDVI